MRFAVFSAMIGMLLLSPPSMAAMGKFPLGSVLQGPTMHFLDPEVYYGGQHGCGAGFKGVGVVFC